MLARTSVRAFFVGITIFGGVMETTSLYGGSKEVAEMTAEDVFFLTPEELSKAIGNVEKSLDARSAARIANYYLNYLSEDKLGCLWQFIAAQLGDKYSEYCLFAGGVRKEDIFTLEVLNRCAKQGFSESICEYVKTNMYKNQGKQYDCNKENLLLKNADIAEFRECRYKFKTHSGRTNEVLVVYRKPRIHRQVTGFVLSTQMPGVLSREWVLTLEKYGDQADRDGLLLVNVFWHGQNDESDIESIGNIIKEAMHQISTQENVSYKGLIKNFEAGSDRIELVKNALQDI